MRYSFRPAARVTDRGGCLQSTHRETLAGSFGAICDRAFLRDLIHKVVRTIRKHLNIDWVESHGEDVKTMVKVAVRRVLRRRNVREKDSDPFLDRIIQRAETLYADRPCAA